MKSQDYFIKKANQRKWNKFQEQKMLAFASGATALLALILFCFSFNIQTKSFGGLMLTLSGVFFIEAAVAFVTWRLAMSQILKFNAIKRGLRLVGVLLIATIATGNIFCALAGLILIKREKNLEYTIGCYMILVEVLIIMVSALNVFKPWVVDTYFIGMGIFGAVIIIHAIALPLVVKYVDGNRANKRAIPLAIILMITTLTGNLFSLLLGIILLRKASTKEDNVSIGWIDVVKRLFRSQMAVIGAFIIIFLLTLSVSANLTFDYGVAINNEYSIILNSPSATYPFGTDDYGRCVFTRVVFGAKISLTVGVVSTILSIVAGIILGAIAGFYSGTTDNLVMRILDVFMAIPGLLLPIAIIAAFGTSTANIVLALGLGAIPSYARTIRASVLTLSDVEFVEAARACGARDKEIIFKHILPNSMAPLIIRATLGIGGGVTAVSSLSYLGLGIPPQIPEWGNILKAGSTYLETNSYMAIFPGLAIVILVLAFNFLGDGLRDALDPKLK